MRATTWSVVALVLVWLGLQADAVRVALTAPGADGVTPELARLQGVLLRQLIASGVAIAAWVIGRSLPRGPLRWLSLAPVLLMAALGLAVILQNVVT